MQKWSVETLDERVDEEIAALPSDMRAHLTRISRLVETFGPFQVGMPHLRPLQDKLWEFRAHGKDGIARSIYVLATGRRVVVLHAFVKKTQKTPLDAIRTALQRAKEAELL